MVKKLLALGCIFFLMNSAFAVKVASLYQVNLTVTSQQNEERNQAIKKGLQEVLIKLTGNPTMMDTTVIQECLMKAEQYVEEFSYTAANNINIRYNSRDINRLLKKANIAYWGENRPLILAWLMITHQNQEATILGNDTDHQLLDTIKKESKHYGLPLIFPVMDMTDLSLVSSQVIEEKQIALLKEAGKRYTPDGLLVGKMMQIPGKVISEWQLILGSQKWDWTINQSSLEETFSAVFKQASLIMAKHYAVKTTSNTKTWMKLQISSVRAGEDLQALTHYLKELAPVQQVELSQISGDTIELAILIRGPIAAFQENAAISQHLILQSFDEKNQKWLYEWIH